jgi:hypothetical protein
MLRRRVVEIANLAEPNKRQYPHLLHLLCFGGEAYITPFDFLYQDQSLKLMQKPKAFRSPTDHVKS